jgi:hypothetical protein
MKKKQEKIRGKSLQAGKSSYHEVRGWRGLLFLDMHVLPLL